jgi:hypothetical protein
MRTLATHLAVIPALLLGAACGNAPAAEAPKPERTIGVDVGGNVVKTYSMDDEAQHTFAAPEDRVFNAVVAAYTLAGIPPTVADRPGHRYGNEGFIVPREFAGGKIGDFFRCGDDLGGPLVNRGTVVANVVTTLAATSPGSTVTTTSVSARVRRNDGASSVPVTCTTTGRLEEQLRQAIATRLNSVKK